MRSPGLAGIAWLVLAVAAGTAALAQEGPSQPVPAPAPPAPVAPAEPGDDGHGKKVEFVLHDLDPDQRRRVLEAWAHVICNCPRENWSKTLLNCPDGCALPQRRQVQERVIDGWDLGQIVAEQVTLHGPKAAADPGTSANGTLLVLAGVIFGGGLAAMVLAAWRRRSEERRAAAESDRANRAVARFETDVVERELREID